LVSRFAASPNIRVSSRATAQQQGRGPAAEKGENRREDAKQNEIKKEKKGSKKTLCQEIYR
jgi:hypothetical protein